MTDPVNPDAVLSEALTGLSVLLSNELTEGTLHELGVRYDLTLRLMAILKDVRDALEVALIEAMPVDTLEMDGVQIVRERKTRSTWKDSGAARMREDIEHAVATKLATDVMTGEVDPMRRNLISHAIHELWSVLPAPSSMKAGAKSFNLKIGDYRTFTEGYNLRVVVPEEEAS